jgi:glycosyltransferase involved in cell wall biosynthesis
VHAMSDKKISVILPCYNGGKYLSEAISSILKQTHKNIELIIINDGSKDDSLAVINSYAQQDQRIRVVSRENRGLVRSLNEGISLATGEYIARMDQDDISLAHRLEKQLAYMESKNLDLVGAAVLRFKSGEEKTKPKYYPTAHDELATSIITLGPSFAHPTVLARRQVFDSFQYDPRYEYAEDYALWLKITLSHKFRLGNVNEILLHYRRHETQMTTLKKDYQKQMMKKLYGAIMQEFIVSETKTLNAIFDFWRRELRRDIFPGVFYVPVWINRLAEKNCITGQIKSLMLKKAVKNLL